VKATSLRVHSRVILSKYGMSGEQYAALYEFQGGRCAICKRARGKSKRLAVDHNHANGEVRGLLCGPCNSMLAHARDDPGMFTRAADYLNDPPYGRMPK
jgi:hypothetical protein